MATVLVTGANGTLGQPLCAALAARGDTVVRWDRRAVDPHDETVAGAFVRDLGPEVVFHLAVASRPSGLPDEGRRVNVGWTERLGRACNDIGCRLVFTSTAMVFTNDATGPFDMTATPDARDGYGGEKRLCEERLPDLCPDAVIARLGWQIGERPGSNNMLDYFAQNASGDGRVGASSRWLPACSFLDDTVAALLWLSTAPSGLYAVDSNRRWTFFDIARALSNRHGNRWHIDANEDFVYDQRLIDPRVPMPALDERLPELS